MKTLRYRRLSNEPLLGSYEESLILGRTSLPCSLPISFLAKIGVIGQGNSYNSKLKLPKHLLKEFNAVFYDLDNNKTSPYTGVIKLDEDNSNDNDNGTNNNNNSLHEINLKKRKKSWYQIPPKGQIQVIVSDSNKISTSFFLVPYDLIHMPRMTRTFIRQKTFSSSNPKHLIKAIHIPISRLKNEKLYIYGSVRVVFEHKSIDFLDSPKSFLLPNNTQCNTEVILGPISDFNPFYVLSTSPVFTTTNNDNYTMKKKYSPNGSSSLSNSFSPSDSTSFHITEKKVKEKSNIQEDPNDKKIIFARTSFTFNAKSKSELHSLFTDEKNT